MTARVIKAVMDAFAFIKCNKVAYVPDDMPFEERQQFKQIFDLACVLTELPRWGDWDASRTYPSEKFAAAQDILGVWLTKSREDPSCTGTP